MTDDELINRTVTSIYASVLGGELRQVVLESMRARLGGSAAVWFLPNWQSPLESFVGMVGLDADALQPYSDYYIHIDNWHKAAMEHPAPAILTGAQVGTIHTWLKDDECINDYLAKQLGVTDICASVIEKHDDLVSHVSVYRSRDASA